MGGAIYYDSYRPSLNNITYVNNSAVYGFNIASYPIKIIKLGSSNNSIELNDVGSSITYTDALALSIVDYDGQEIKNDNTSQIKIVPVTINANAKGVNYAKLTQGVGQFSGLIFEYAPGSPNVKYVATSSEIDQDMIETVFGQQFSNNSVTVNFRYCQPGEIQDSEASCVECSQGTYSLEWNSTVCEKCMDNAVCLGNSEIEVNPGYWRMDL